MNHLPRSFLTGGKEQREGGLLFFPDNFHGSQAGGGSIKKAGEVMKNLLAFSLSLSHTLMVGMAHLRGRQQVARDNTSLSSRQKEEMREQRGWHQSCKWTVTPNHYTVVLPPIFPSFPSSLSLSLFSFLTILAKQTHPHIPIIRWLQKVLGGPPKIAPFIDGGVLWWRLATGTVLVGGICILTL